MPGIEVPPESTHTMNSKTIKFIAMIALSLCGKAVFSHGNTDHEKPRTVIKEQKTWGIAGEARTVSKTVTVVMTDAMRFTPDRIDVRQGETLRIVVKNDGKMLHEFVIGTPKDLDEHAALMVKFPTMEHDEPYMTHVPPGQTGQIIWTFNRSGEFDFACLIAGHYQAGMVGKFTVRTAPHEKDPSRTEHKH